MGRNSGLDYNEVLFLHHNIALGTLAGYPAGRGNRLDGRFRLLSAHRHYTGIHRGCGFAIHGFASTPIKGIIGVGDNEPVGLMTLCSNWICSFVKIILESIPFSLIGI